MSNKRLSDDTIDEIATARAHLSDVLGDDDPLLKPKQTKAERKRLKAAKKKATKSLPSNDILANAILDECRKNGIRITKGKRPNRLAGRWVDEALRKRRMAKFAPVIDAAFAKAQHETIIAKSRASIAKSEIKINAAKQMTKAYEADADEALQKMADANEELRLMEQQIASLDEGIRIVEVNLQTGLDQIAAAQTRKAEREAQRIIKEESDWSAKAAMTLDPILAAGYRERAEAVANGETFSDD